MYKYHLEDVEWREFVLGEIFTIKKVYGKMIDKYDIGQLPYISTSASENGLIGFVETDEIRSISCGNAISIDPIGGKCFYHKYNFVGREYSGASINLLYNEMINEINSKFIMTCIEQTSKTKSSYGNLFNSNRLLKGKIKLPISKNEEINWYFMEEYIKERENKQRNDLKEYYKSRLLDLVICPEILTDVEWGEFSLRDLFVFERGNQNNMSVCEAGDIPLISAKKIDNGVKAFISDNGKKLFEGHILTLNNDGDGGVGIAYYQANKMALDTHVTALIPIIPINRSSLLFISKTITIQRDKFSHGYSLNNNRMKAQKIVLPIDKNSNPNWSYMENFIKNIEQKQIKNVLKYLDKYIYIYI